MRWRARVRATLSGLVWIGVVLAVAAYGSVVVRNVTDALAGIAHPSRVEAVLEWPSR
jgi:hypothetical protein